MSHASTVPSRGYPGVPVIARPYDRTGGPETVASRFVIPRSLSIPSTACPGGAGAVTAPPAVRQDGGMSEPSVLWTPPADVRETTRIGDYLGWLARERGRTFEDYRALWQWSVDDLAGFWSSIWDYFQVAGQPAPEPVLSDTGMPGARWFPQARLNYADHVLRAPGLGESDPVVLSWSQSRPATTLTLADLREQVRRVAAGLRRLGVTS